MDKPISEMNLVELVRAIPVEKLIALVMGLTGGTANPKVVAEQIDQWKRRE